MKESTFNVVVPTRERADTLVSTLRALVEINYSKLKIIVCDNASAGKTREVVDGFKDQRIHYSRSSERLSMAQNWQRGLSLIDEGYITYVGDDDALLIGAIPQLNVILNDSHVRAIAWDKIEYPWPNCTIEEIRGRLDIPLSNQYEIRSGHKTRNSVKRLDVHYTKLPCLYNSFVDVELIKNLNRGTPFFHGALSPDIYTGIVLSYHVGDYIYSKRPFSINGVSAHSGGASGFYSKDKSAANKFISEIDIEIDKRLVLGSSMAISIALEFWNVYRHFGYEDSYLDINEIISNTKKELRRLNGDRYEYVYSLLRQIVEKNRVDLAILEDLPVSVSDAPTEPKMGFDSVSNRLAFDSRKVGVRNVFEAAKISDLLLPPIKSFKRESFLRRTRRKFKDFRKSLRRRRDAFAEK